MVHLHKIKTNPNSKLADNYEFFQYTDGQDRPLLGQYVAVVKGSGKPSTNDTQVLSAVVKKYDRPNPEVVEGLLNSAFVSELKIAEVDEVAKNHPKLIEFLLAREEQIGQASKQ